MKRDALGRRRKSRKAAALARCVKRHGAVAHSASTAKNGAATGGAEERPAASRRRREMAALWREKRATTGNVGSL